MSKPPSNQVILASHGTDDPIGAGLIHDLVGAVAAALPEVQIHEAFVDVQQPDLSKVLDSAVAADPTSVFSIVPLFLGTGYHVKNDMASALVQALEVHPNSKIELVRAFQSAPAVINIMVDRLLALKPIVGDVVLFTTAGSSDESSREQASETFELFKLALAKRFTGLEVELAYLSAAEPRLKDLVPKLKFQNSRRRVLVATHLLAPGYFYNLIKKSGAHLATPPLLAEGEKPDARLVDLVVQRIQEAGDPAGTLRCGRPVDPSRPCIGCYWTTCTGQT